MPIFCKEKEEYKRDLNILNSYIKQTSFYISKMKDISLNDAKEIVKKEIQNNLKDPSVKYFHRKENGDREVANTTLLNYISNNIKNDDIIVPTFTTYLNPNKKRSIVASYAINNVKTRSISKKEAQIAKAENNMDLYIAKNGEQATMKLYNNSLSGAFAQSSCILFNETAHNTLTSITRTMSSLANANNELLLAGNRYFFNPIDVLNNCVYIASNCDSENIKDTCDKYNLYIPTVEDTISVLKRSTDLYFQDDKYFTDTIIPFLNKLTKYELTAICYINDLYHIRKFNDKFMRNFLDGLSTKIVSNNTNDDIPSKLYKIDENTINYVHQIWFSDVKGYGKKYDKLHSEGKASSLLSTAYHIESILNHYKDFIQCFFVNDITPPLSNKVKNMRRRVVVLSDTDSTCFTLDEWVKWYNGEFYISDKTIAIAGGVSFICTEVIKHMLAKLSANLNVEKDHLYTLAMKNEFLWTAHMPAEVSKHYTAYTVMQEGNVFAEPELEIKGVHLKNSAVPKFIIEDSKKLIELILSSVHNNKKISLNSILKHVMDVENNIKDSIYKGEPIYLKKSSIKNKEAYVNNQDQSPYQHHLLWEEVFASTYGNIPLPPYNVVKVPTILTTRKKLVSWIENIENKELSNRLLNSIQKSNKTTLPTIYINMDYAESKGIPKEVQDVVDIKRIILDVTIQYRIILDALGLFIEEDKTISEMFSYKLTN